LLAYWNAILHVRLRHRQHGTDRSGYYRADRDRSARLAEGIAHAWPGDDQGQGARPRVPGHIEDAARDTGLDDLKKDINKATSGLSAKSLLDDKPRTPGKVDKPAETPKPAADKPAETPKPAAETSKPAAEPAKSGESKA
jgi:hypothetical protein